MFNSLQIYKKTDLFECVCLDVRYGQRSEKAIRSPRTGVTDGCQALHRCYKLNPGLFQE